MKGFIEVTSDSRVKMFLSVSGIWSMAVEANGLVGIYVNPQSPGKHFEVLESMDEIAAKIEAATEQQIEPRQNIYYRTEDRLPTAEDADKTNSLGILVSKDGNSWYGSTLNYAQEWQFWAPVPKVEVRE